MSSSIAPGGKGGRPPPGPPPPVMPPKPTAPPGKGRTVPIPCRAMVAEAAWKISGGGPSGKRSASHLWSVRKACFVVFFLWVRCGVVWCGVVLGLVE